MIGSRIIIVLSSRHDIRFKRSKVGHDLVRKVALPWKHGNLPYWLLHQPNCHELKSSPIANRFLLSNFMFNFGTHHRNTGHKKTCFFKRITLGSGMVTDLTLSSLSSDFDDPQCNHANVHSSIASKSTSSHPTNLRINSRNPRNSIPPIISIPISRIRFLLAILILLAAFIYLSAVSQYSNVSEFQSSPSLTPSKEPVDFEVLTPKSILNGKQLRKSTVAVCIAGQIRTFRNPHVRSSIHYHILQSLRDKGFFVHTFFHLSTSDITHNDFDGIYNTETNDSIFTSFTPASFSFYRQPQPRSSTSYLSIQDDDCPVSKCQQPHASSRKVVCPHTLLRADECMRRVEIFQNKYNISFEWIIRTRPDIALASNISVSSLSTDKVYTNMHMSHMSKFAHPWLRQQFPKYAPHILNSNNDNVVGDLIYVVPAKLANVVFRASNAFQDCQLFQMSNGTIGPEVALVYWLVKHTLNFESFPWLWMIVRHDTGPVCENVKFIRTNDEDLNLQMDSLCHSFKSSGVLSHLE